MTSPHSKSKEVASGSRLLGVAALLISLAALAASFWQAFIMRQSMRVDQRAWVSVAIPTVFPLNGSSIPIVTQVQNTGKTPATDVEGNYFAAVLKKGEVPALGDFSVGHVHNELYLGAVFPNSPVPTTLTVLRYSPMEAVPVVPDEPLRQDIANGDRYIVFYGKITYLDVFGVRHWTQFCTGSGTAILEQLKACIAYNDVDHND